MDGEDAAVNPVEAPTGDSLVYAAGGEAEGDELLEPDELLLMPADALDPKVEVAASRRKPDGASGDLRLAGHLPG